MGKFLDEKAKLSKILQYPVIFGAALSTPSRFFVSPRKGVSLTEYCKKNHPNKCVLGYFDENIAEQSRVNPFPLRGGGNQLPRGTKISKFYLTLFTLGGGAILPKF